MHRLLFLLLTGCSTTCPPGSALNEEDGLCYLLGAHDTGESSTDTTPATPVSAQNISAVVSEHIRTVVTVTWDTETATTGYLEFGETDSYGMTSPLTDAGTAHSALMLGLWADTTFHFRVVTVSEDGTETASADQTITTGSLPVEVPELTTMGTATWDGFLFAPFQGINYLAVAIDNHGRVVWYKVIDSDTHHIMRAEPMFNGEGVAICMAGQDSQGNKEDGYVLMVSMDGSSEVEIATPYIDHDMTLMPDNTISGIVLKESDTYVGTADSIQEITHDSEMVEIFDVWDHMDSLTDTPPETRSEGDENSAWNWSHANALDYDAAEETYYMALKELHTMVRVDRNTGEMMWAFGGQGNQYTWVNGTDPLTMHHQFHAYEDGRIVVFENGAPERGYSMVREFVIDEDNLTAEEVWSYVREPSVYVYAKGDVERLTNGNTLVTWSSSGEIQEVTPDGAVQWQVNTELGAAITFVTRTESLYDR